MNRAAHVFKAFIHFLSAALLCDEPDKGLKSGNLAHELLQKLQKSREQRGPVTEKKSQNIVVVSRRKNIQKRHQRTGQKTLEGIPLLV